MKNRASNFLKQIIRVIKTIANAKSALTLKSTKQSALKSRLIVLSLLKNKNVLKSTIAHKLHAMLPRHYQDPHVNGGASGSSNNITIADSDDDDQRKSVVLYNDTSLNYHNQSSCTSGTYEYMNVIEEEEDEKEKYPDLTHSLMLDDLEKEPGGAGKSVIELVRNSKEEEGEDFVLEDDIDQVADLFIKKFHRQILMQKQLSLKRYQEMLDRSV